MIRQCMIAPTLARSSSHQYPPTLSTISDGTRWIRRPMTSIAKTDVEKEVLDSVAADDAPRIIKPPPISLCQLDNHPDYRLQQARVRLANQSCDMVKTVQHGVSSIQSIENPVRSNDGTSSGALAADRLRMARRRAFENMATKSFSSVEKPVQINTFPQSEASIVKEKRVYQSIENPIRSNDGTSSGAIAADRLRMARRKALQNISQIEQTSPRANSTSQTSIQGTIKEHGIDITAIESKVKKNDGTSSGATAADRLRIARRKAIEKMKQQSDGQD